MLQEEALSVPVARKGSPLPSTLLAHEDWSAVERISVSGAVDGGRATLEAVVAANRPVIVDGLADNWNAWERWFIRSPREQSAEEARESGLVESDSVAPTDVRNCAPLLTAVGATTNVAARTRFAVASLTSKEEWDGTVARSDASPASIEDERGTDAKNDGRGDEWLGVTEQVRFGELFEWWQKTEGTWYDPDAERSGSQKYLYLASLPIAKSFPMLTDDVTPAPPQALDQAKSGNLWIGSPGQITPLHFDFSTGDPGMDGLHVVLFGRKRFRLFDPRLASNIACIPRRNFWGRFHQAKDTDETGLPVDPNFRSSAEAICVDLMPGETLFIPKLWWHHVETLAPSVAVNFWFQSLASEKLKLTTLWPAIERQLELTADMYISQAKLRNVLQFFGIDRKNHRLTDDEVNAFRTTRVGRLKLMALERYIQSAGAGCRAPWTRNLAGAHELDEALTARVRAWIENELEREAS